MMRWRKSQNIEPLRQRFRDDYQFAMIVLFGLLAAAVVAGFTVYRYLHGAYLGAAVDLMIVISVLLVLAYAVQSGQTARAGYLFAVVTVVGCIASAVLFGRTGLMWSFVVLWINFLLTSRRFALLMNLALIGTLCAATDLFFSALEGLTYVVTTLLITVFGWIFAGRLAGYQQQLETLALQDPLTFAGNRRMLKRDLNAAMSENRRAGREFTLALLDLDHFKTVNDELGHEAGDQALREFSDLMRAHIRAEDGFYRFGGEEFVLLLPGHGAATGLSVAEALHERVSGKLSVAGKRLYFSAGVAVLQPNEDWSSWLARADRAMYQAKRSGRNRVIMAGSSHSRGCTRAASAVGNRDSRPAERPIRATRAQGPSDED